MLNFLDAACGIEGLEDIVYYGVLVIRVLQIVAPIFLIIWGTLDFIKAMISNDERKILEGRKPFIKRLISAILIFLIPWIVDFSITHLVSDSSNQWIKCYQVASK